jgi:hypothetical protein
MLGRELCAPAASAMATLAAALIAHRTVLGDGLAGLVLAVLTGALVHGTVFVFFGGSALGDIRRLLSSFGSRSPASGSVLPEPDRTET